MNFTTLQSDKEMTEDFESIFIKRNNLTKEMDIPEETLCAIFRYKFTQDFMDELYKFSKIHQYDERKDFKEAWKVWLDENEDIVNVEARRMKMLGYDGDVFDKMFKSARYYFRKKSDEKKEPKERRKYVGVSSDLLEAMDKHIDVNMLKDNYQPKTGFISFCHENEDLLKKSINMMLENGINDGDYIQEKIKKTYKNRYFMLAKKK
jgi:hypothetical protein